MIEITSMDHNGRGIGKLNNKIVFVKNALPGEIVNLKILKEKKNFIEAEVLSYIKKAENRIESACPYYLECGGCDLLHLNYNDQLKFKQDKINNIINRYLDANITINYIVKCDDNFNYRNKVSFQVKEKIGFYNDKTYEIIPVESCLIGNKLINNSIKYLNKLDLKNISKIICRTGNNKLMIILESTTLDLDITSLKEIADSIYIKKDNEYILKYKDKYITESLNNYKYLISPDSFFQININICIKLYNKIKEYVGSGNNVIDLYCGTGSIGIFISENNNVIGIELNKYAILDANLNKELNNLKNIDFICGDSGKMLNKINFKPDIIIVDPPRSGLSKETITNLLKYNPKKIIYVSCDPMTLARDLNILKEHYNIDELTPYDMFPNTKHVECLCLLTKK